MQCREDCDELPKAGAHQAGKWLTVSSLDRELIPAICSGIRSSKRMDGLAIDVEGGPPIDDSLPTLAEENDCVWLGVVN